MRGDGGKREGRKREKRGRGGGGGGGGRGGEGKGRVGRRAGFGGRRRAPDPLAGPGPAARCGVLPGVDCDGHRHGRLAPEGLRLRGSHSPPRCSSCSGGRGRRSIAGPPSSTRASPPRGLRRWPVPSALRCGWGSLRSSTSSTERALVAVRAARRGVAVPARFGRRGPGPAAVAFARLVGHAPHEAPVPTDADLDGVARAIAAQSSTSPFLVYLRDKAILFNDSRTAFIMYGVEARTGWHWEIRSGPKPNCPACACVSRAVRRFRRRARLLRSRKRRAFICMPTSA